MTTRTKLNLVAGPLTLMCVLHIFSNPLHIPPAWQQVLGVGILITAGSVFYLIKKLKQERQNPLSPPGQTGKPPTAG